MQDYPYPDTDAAVRDVHYLLHEFELTQCKGDWCHARDCAETAVLIVREIDSPFPPCVICNKNYDKHVSSSHNFKYPPSLDRDSLSS